MINNHVKLSRWAVQSYLSGIDIIKLAYVSRKDTKSNNDHIICGFQDMETRQLITHTNFIENVGWGMVKQLVETLRESTDGNFIICKVISGAKQLIKILRVKDA